MNPLFVSFTPGIDNTGLIVPSISKYSAWPTIRRDPNNGNLLLVYTEKNHHVGDSSRLILLIYNIKEKHPFWTKKELAYSLPDSVPNHNVLPKGGSITIGNKTKRVIVTWSHSNNYWYNNPPDQNSEWFDILSYWQALYNKHKDSNIKPLIDDWINKCKVDYKELVNLISGGCANPDGNIKIAWHELIDTSKPFLPIVNPHPKITTGTMHGGIELGDGRFLFIGGDYYLIGKQPLVGKQSIDTGIITEIEVPKNDNSRIFLRYSSTVYPYSNDNADSNDKIVNKSLREPSIVEYDYDFSAFDEKTNNTCAVNTNNSKLLVIFRNEEGDPNPLLAYGFYSSRSVDSGKTWSTPMRLNLKDQHGNDILFIDSDSPEVIKLNDGRLLLTFSYRNKDSNVYSKTCKIFASVSADNGESWSNTVIISEFYSHPSNCGCPSSVQLEDGSIITVWYQQVHTDYPTLNKKINSSDFKLLSQYTNPLDMSWLFARNWDLSLFDKRIHK